MASNFDMIWTKERTAEALRLRQDGKSAREIGAIMGSSRAAVLGALHRHAHPRAYAGFRGAPREKTHRGKGGAPVNGREWGGWDLEEEDRRRAIWAKARTGAKVTRRQNRSRAVVNDPLNIEGKNAESKEIETA